MAYGPPRVGPISRATSSQSGSRGFGFLAAGARRTTASPPVAERAARRVASGVLEWHERPSTVSRSGPSTTVDIGVYHTHAGEPRAVFVNSVPLNGRQPPNWWPPNQDIFVSRNQRSRHPAPRRV